MNIIEKLGITQGPWKWVQKYDYDFLTTNGVDDSCESIIDDGSAHGEYGQTIKADSPNALLIAAAPDMLEALIDCLNFYEYGLRADDPRQQSFLKAIESVEKATGKTWEEIKELDK